MEARLKELDLTLPAAKPPVANYLPALMHSSSGGRVEARLTWPDLPAPKSPVANPAPSARVTCSRFRQSVCGGRWAARSIARRRSRARDAMLDLLAIIKQDIGDLDRIVSVERLHGFVRSAPTFIAQPEVIDGASDLLVELLGPAGRHARTATGVNQLPFGAAVQLDLILRLI